MDHLSDITTLSLIHLNSKREKLINFTLIPKNKNKIIRGGKKNKNLCVGPNFLKGRERKKEESSEKIELRQLLFSATLTS